MLRLSLLRDRAEVDGEEFGEDAEGESDPPEVFNSCVDLVVRGFLFPSSSACCGC